jgi:hypothetical protein
MCGKRDEVASRFSGEAGEDIFLGRDDKASFVAPANQAQATHLPARLLQLQTKDRRSLTNGWDEGQSSHRMGYCKLTRLI